MERLPRYRTGDPELDAAVAELVTRSGAVEHVDLVFEMIVSALRMARDAAARGDFKIANSALKEMRYAFHVFEPYRGQRKVAVFGSARTMPEDPLYEQARAFAAAMAERDWMVITGAGPGIMSAGIEGAGTENSFGVNIRLPFEASTSQFIADDPKLINFRYFFTRKLAFIKESHGFVLLPGGFGTMDEGFELLTLVQTGKSHPAPIVLLEVPGGTYWASWKRFVEDELMVRRLISPDDLDLVHITDDVDDAVREIEGFYSNFHSIRFVDRALVVRLREPPVGRGAGAPQRGVRRHRDLRADRGRPALPGRDRRPRPRRPGPHPVPVRPHPLGPPPQADRRPQRPERHSDGEPAGPGGVRRARHRLRRRHPQRPRVLGRRYAPGLAPDAIGLDEIAGWLRAGRARSSCSPAPASPPSRASPTSGGPRGSGPRTPRRRSSPTSTTT